MPEGPEIKYLGELCKKNLINYNLVNIISNSKSKVKLPIESKLIDIQTKGKLLILIFKDFYFNIHFGLTGWLILSKENDNNNDDNKYSKYPKYELFFRKDNINIKAYIDDMRRFSKLKIIKKKEDHDKILNKLGVDILSKEFTLDFFIQIKNNKKLITALLLDQDKMCGIGNYIKNESLYIAKISPFRKASSLSDDEIKHLYNAIKYVAYSNLVEQLKDDKLKVDKIYKSINISVPYKLKVYEQDKDPKGNKVIIENISGRRTFYVKQIQI